MENILNKRELSRTEPVILFHCCRKKREEMKILEETIQKQRNEMHKKAGSDMEATCHICMKTKFADGIGHICNYCNIRCCARCGGKVTLRSNKVSTSTYQLSIVVVTTITIIVSNSNTR